MTRPNIAALLWVFGAVLAAVIVWTTTSDDAVEVANSYWATGLDVGQAQPAAPPLPPLLLAASTYELPVVPARRARVAAARVSPALRDVLSRAPKRPPPAFV